ncbi:Helix-turn-helix domain-containing protein [Kytococcus aerolatus]|uniref:Helix-turn-helix domain-containing protein n=1 Tax=Kytococcus aerolatus TaxID=592308 RepID=A0A212TEK5_9MICO|nr:helix-turn-helix transcriptional regulator [Kytococcus aerolatus]SNC64433.1 Helix-turn-helix domain-containing protein [Kytococcus aerolatus]
MSTATPRPVVRAMRSMGEDLHRWRRLQGLSREVVADRAGVSLSTVKRIEAGQGASLEHVLRVARALGVMDSLVESVDPLASDVGRMRAVELLDGTAAGGRRR